MSKPLLNKSNVAQQASLLSLPEKVIQFGTGVLLRGLPDYFIHRANEKGVFNGRVVVVKSTSKGGTDEFTQQDNLFTHVTRGVYKGEVVNSHFINTSISRVLMAKKDWSILIDLAKSESIEVVISNTTEAGLILDEADQLNDQAPESFPAKLLALLYTRWQHFNGDVSKGWVILPTELVPDNGKVLLELLHTLASKWQLSNDFISWMTSANQFCNTLVDRIVPGILTGAEMDHFSEANGYKDDLLISSEPFALWAIECSNQDAIQKISFTTTDDRMVVAPSIVKFRELKLRLLNGTHTFCCAVAILAGFETVVQAMQDKAFYNFIHSLVFNEIAPCVVGDTITKEDADKFGASVLERFANPFIEHKWSSISLNFEEKMKMRNQYLIQKYFDANQSPADKMSLGFAAFKIYMQQENQKEMLATDYCTDASFATKVKEWETAILEKGMKNILG
jgi:tagaturonate reductase